MGEFLCCALLIPGLAFARQWGPYLAQAVIAPIGMAVMDEQHAARIMRWYDYLLTRFKPPNLSILVFNEHGNYTIHMGDERPNSDFGMVLVPFLFGKDELLKALQAVAPGGRLVLHDKFDVISTVTKLSRSA